MSHVNRVFVFLHYIAASLIVCGAAHAAAPPPAEAFGHLPAETDVQLSPDGHWLAWLDHKEAKPRIIVFDLLGRKVQRVMAVPEDKKLRSLAWSDNETLLIMVTATKEAITGGEFSEEWYRTIAEDVSGGEGRMLPINEMHSTSRSNHPPLATLLRAHTAKPHTVIMVSGVSLLEVDTRTGLGKVVKVGNEFTTMWAVDRSGEPVARVDWDYRHHSYRVLALQANDQIKEIFRKDDSEHPKLVGLLGDGSALVLLATNGRPHQAAWALPLDGSPPTLLAEEPDADITAVNEDPYTGAIIGVYASGTVTRTHWLEQTAEHRKEVLQRAFAGKEIDVQGWTEDGTKALAKVQTPSTPPVYYIVDFTAHRADIAAEEYPELSGIALADVKLISYKARDGTSIPAYLAMPGTKPDGPMPLVVLPHGGPQARDYLQFNWLVQFLASRGYAVLQPQFRGSTGFGEAFEQAGYRQWGGLMQDDVTDGVHAMIEQGVADPHRVCIVGASYGGYAALAGAAFTPDLYACAVSISGVSDLQALLMEETADYGWGGWGGADSTTLAAWKAHVGEPRDPNLATRSPINSVKTIRAPILIIYGTGDGVVPNAQSQKMANALKSAGKSVDVSVLPGEDHWLSRNDTRIQVLQQLDVFLRAHL